MIRPPKPPLRKPYPKRLPIREKAVTVCIAGIHQRGNEACIILACDKKITFFNGLCAGDDIADKLVRINDNWVVMVSGDVSPLVLIVESIKEKVSKLRSKSFRSFALACSKAYQDERANIIENEVLLDYDIRDFSEYRSLKNTDEQRFNLVTEEIKKREEGWSLLFAGFDRHEEPHLFVLGERGKIQ